MRACVYICACVNDNQVSGNGSSGATCKHNTTHCHKERIQINQKIEDKPDVYEIRDILSMSILGHH